MYQTNKFDAVFKKANTSYQARRMMFSLVKTCASNEEKELLYETFRKYSDPLEEKEINQAYREGFITEYV